LVDPPVNHRHEHHRQRVQILCNAYKSDKLGHFRVKK
jgi:hypothetical protein